MLDPKTIMLAMPCGDGRMMAETAGMLVSSRNLFAGISLTSECAVIQIARNTIADNFLRSPYEWLICQDSDIVARPEDYRLLLEPCDSEAKYWTPELTEEQVAALPAGAPPRPSRVRTNQDGLLRAADMLVAAEYAYKNDTLEPVKLGFGFVRIHRSVFETLMKLEHEENPVHKELVAIIAEMRDAAAKARDTEAFTPMSAALLETAARIEKCLPDPGGGPRLWQGVHNGRLITDFFPTGPIVSRFVPTAQWKGEDHGFFTLCHMAGIIPRIETRTRLIHIGRKGYPYMGPDGGGGQ